MTSPQKQKGKNYENLVAKFLTEQYGEPFMRVPSSGAYLGGQNYDRRHIMSEGQVRACKGDIIPPDSWNYANFECKFYQGFKFHQLYSESKLLDGWIKETISTANADDLNLIFMKFNNIGEYIVYQVNEDIRVDQYTRYSQGWAVTSKEQFWSSTHNIAYVKHRCTQGAIPL
jgi:hypothetical protein